MTVINKIFLISAVIQIAMSVPGENDNKAKMQTAMEKCAEEKKCSLQTIECQALCAGVPNPKASQVDDTTNCVANCSKDDAEMYKVCSQNCINKYFRKIDIPNQVKGANETKADNSTIPAKSTSFASTHNYFTIPVTALALSSLIFASELI